MHIHFRDITRSYNPGLPLPGKNLHESFHQNHVTHSLILVCIYIERCPQHFHIHPIRTHDKRPGRVLGYFKKTLPVQAHLTFTLTKRHGIFYS